jgi:hypothetical protein
MSLTPDDITNIERGIDAGFDVLLELANRGMVAANSNGDTQATKAFMDFCQSVVAHRGPLGGQALQRAMIQHPDLEEEPAP